MKKKFLIVTGVIVLITALVGFWGYNKYFTPDQEIQQQLNSQFGPDFFNSFDDEKVVDDTKLGDNSAKLNDIPVIGSMSETGKEQDADRQLTSSTPVDKNVVAKRITQDDINNIYNPQFSHLKNVALSRLDTLYSAALQEYKQGRKDGTLNRGELVQKYIQAGTMLEANMDKQFSSTLYAMQAELIANNLPTDILGVIKSEYENAKSDKRSELLAKARK